MADTSKPKPGKEEAAKPDIEVKPEVPDPAAKKPYDGPERRSKPRTAADDEAFAIEKSARPIFERYFPEGVTTSSVEYLRSVSRFDPRETRVQPAEMWRYRDREIENGERF